MIYNHYSVLISIYTARSRLACDEGERDGSTRRGSGRDETRTVAVDEREEDRKCTEVRSAVVATNQLFRTNYEWYIRCIQVIYIAPMRWRGSAEFRDHSHAFIAKSLRTVVPRLRVTSVPPEIQGLKLNCKLSTLTSAFRLSLSTNINSLSYIYVVTDSQTAYGLSASEMRIYLFTYRWFFDCY